MRATFEPVLSAGRHRLGSASTVAGPVAAVTPDGTPDAEAPLFSARALTMRYGSTVALDGIDLDIARGEIVGLVGANGAGKTTLTNLICGVISPTEGTMTLAGEHYNPTDRDAALAAGVSSIPQSYPVPPDVTVAEAIFATSFQHSLPLAQKTERAREALGASGIDIEPDALLTELSRAELSCVNMLRVSFEESHLVLLDEITATANDYEIATLHSIVHRLAAQGRAVVYISHRLDEIESLPSRVVVVRDGRIHHDASPAESGGVAGITRAMFGRELTEIPPLAPLESPKPLLVINALESEHLAPVSLQVHRGEILGVTGTRRSGHSELAALIGGATPRTGGTMLFGGELLDFSTVDAATELGIAYLSESDHERGFSDFDTIASAFGTGDSVASFAEEALSFRRLISTMRQLNIASASLHSMIGELSLGDQQKLALARWLQRDLGVAELDHPTRGVDVASRLVVYRMMRDIAARGGAVVLVSSDTTELVEQCHRVAIMRDGHLVATHPADEITEDTLAMVALGHRRSARRRPLAQHPAREGSQ